ncbi:MAG: right-handed parallel beta-helix repeat-containing protein, partial [Alphaproteobacteria bacterium]
QHPVRFEGTLTMPDDKVLSLVRAFDLPTYVAAFGNETVALRKALQALFHFTDHEALDLGGMRISVEAPIDVQAAVGDILSFSNRRVLRNGQLEAVPGPAWDTVTVSSTASYDPASPTRLSNVANVANVPVGARVIGAGVGREIYVRDRNVSAGTLTLSKPLHGAAGTSTFQFERFQYLLDFSGFEWLSRFVVADVEFKCNGAASGLMLPRDGLVTHVRDCFFTEPRDRAITSIGSGCQGMLVDRCQFLSNEQSLNAQDRTSVAINTNANDVKIRDNRFVRFRHAMVLGGSGNIIQGNHAFQGDNQPQGTRLASIVLGQINPKTVINGNYIDNSWIEWTNEFDATPDFSSGFSFGNLSIVGNMFTANDVGNWFRWIVIRPYGQGQFINGLSISDNVFKSLNGAVDRFEGVDASIAPLDMSRARNIRIEGNAFNNVSAPARNPVTLDVAENTPAATWAVDLADFLPFGGIVRGAQSLVAIGPITDTAGATVSDFPHLKTGQGANGTELHVVWPRPVQGKIQVTARVDNPN